MEPIIQGGYIRVVQDVRGKYGSEGDYVMNRPLSGPHNPTPVDHSTDTYDTIDWLVKNTPESNGRVGILGISYDGFLPLMALVNPVWVVKLIDVYPDEAATEPSMGGYQLMVSTDIFRGRYRASLERAQAIEAGKPLPYRFGLPQANHVFLPGHRVMVQVQSTWFPL